MRLQGRHRSLIEGAVSGAEVRSDAAIVHSGLRAGDGPGSAGSARDGRKPAPLSADARDDAAVIPSYRTSCANSRAPARARIRVAAAGRRPLPAAAQRRRFATEVTVFPAVRRMHPRLSSFLFALVCIATSPAPGRAAETGSAATSGARLTACTLPGLPRPARCGRLSVPEDPARPDARRLSLNIVVVPARNGHALPDPVVFLSGGPGQAATRAAAFLSTSLAAINDERDLLLVDQRGTGDSAPLPCVLVDKADPAANLREIFPLAAVKRCAKQLSARADLSQYSLVHFAHDLEAVRVALGYSSLNLFGFSYGTRAAQVYLRTYPATSRTVYLGSLIPMDADTLLELPAAAESALDRTFDACDADTACHVAFPDLRDEFAALLARLDSGRVVVTLPDSRQRVTLRRGFVTERVRSLLYTTDGAAAVPWLLHEAHAGNWQPLVDQLLEVAREMDTQASLGLFFTITCNEDVAFLREADIRARATSSRFGDLRVRSQQAACAAWPRYRIADGYRAPLHSDVPALLVSGELDPATPAALAARAAAGFTQRVELLLRGQAHSGWSDCVAARYTQLLRQGSVQGVSGDCPATARPAFVVSAADANGEQADD